MKIRLILAALTSILFSLYTNAQVSTQIVQETTGERLNGITKTDIQDDGIPEIIMALSNDIVSYTCGADGKWINREILYYNLSSYIYRIYPVDLNEDGLPDLIIQTADGYKVLTNPNTPDVTWSLSAFTSGTYYAFVGFVDMDGDNDKDFVVKSASTKLGYYENIGGTFTTFHLIVEYPTYLYSEGYFDINADGNVDLLISDSGYNYELLLNNGDGTQTSVDAGHIGDHGVQLGDANGDGYGDILFYDGHLSVKLWNPDLNNFDDAIVLGTMPTSEFYAFDADGDGDADLQYFLHPDDTYTLYFSETVTLPDPTTAVAVIDTIGAFAARYLFDVNLDNRVDFIEGQMTDTYVHLQNIDGTFAPRIVADTLTPSVLFSWYGDINNDGDKELLYATENAVYEWLDYDIESNTILSRHTLPKLSTHVTPLCMEVTDIDADGDPDIITSMKAPLLGSEYTGVFLNNGHGTFSKQLINEVAYSQIIPFDADEDGDLDLICAGENTSLYVIKQNSASPLTFETPVLLASYSIASIDLADVNGDGLKDIVAGVTYGDIKKYLNVTGGLFAAATTLLPTTCTAPKYVWSNDFDADGDDDVAFSCSTSAAYMATNSGTGSFTESSIGTLTSGASTSATKLQYMDADNDGIKDLVLNKMGIGNVVKFGTPGGFSPVSTKFSVDFGSLINIDETATTDFVGSDIWNYYISYNSIINSENVNISTPTTDHLAEEGSGDSIVISLSFVPASTLIMHIIPDVKMNIGYGAGIQTDLFFAPDSTALTPRTIHVWHDDADIIPEAAYAGSLQINADEDTWGMAAAAVTTTYTYYMTDNDAGVFFSTTAVDIIENGASVTVTYSGNIYQASSSSVYFTPDDEVNVGSGNGINKTAPIAAGLASVQTQTLIIKSSLNHIDMDDTTELVNIHWESIVPEIDALVIDPVSVNIQDVDSAEIISPLISTAVHQEGTSIIIKFKLTTTPVANVYITIYPDEQLDLGDGPGVPVQTIWAAGTYDVAYHSLTAIVVEDMIAEGLHNSLISFDVTSDDPKYDILTLPSQTLNLSDDITGIEDAGYLEGVAINPSITTGQSTITIPDYNGLVSVDVYNISGQQVMSAQGMNAIPLDLGTQPAGQYILHLQSVNFSTQKTIMVVHD